MPGPALLRGLRPHQWGKNLFVFAPLMFGHAWEDTTKLLRVVGAFAIFCAASSAIYLINDIQDREQDRLHPKKCKRPIASGELSVGTAMVTAVLLAIGALAGSAFGVGSVALATVIAVYLVIQTLYTMHFKHVVVVDVLCIASGFVLRLLAGGYAGGVRQSEWILVCTIFLSLFLALCKRRHEVSSLGDTASDHRAILAAYPLSLLDQFISVATAATIVTYALYTVDDRTVEVHGLVRDGESLPLLIVTIPFVLFGLFRYLYLVYCRDAGGSPTSTLARDLPSLANGVLYLVTVLAVFGWGSGN